MQSNAAKVVDTVSVAVEMLTDLPTLVPVLKDLCRASGLAVGGKKQDLIDRIGEHYYNTHHS